MFLQLALELFSFFVSSPLGPGYFLQADERTRSFGVRVYQNAREYCTISINSAVTRHRPSKIDEVSHV